MTDAGWVSLSFDDALDQHLDVAIPVLDRRRLRGTFYVPIAAPGFLRRQTEWQAAAARGHELGNHTVFHPAVAAKSWVRPGNALDFYSLDRMRLELEFANEALFALDGQRSRTFAYPCSNSCVGHTGWTHAALRMAGLNRTRLAGWVDRYSLDVGATRQSYAPIIGELYPAGRGGGLNRNDRVPPVEQWERTRLLSKACEDWSLADLQAQVTTTLAQHTWCILQFHGVGGGHRMDCDAAVFTEFVAWLDCHYHDRVLTLLQGAQRLWPHPHAGSTSGQFAREAHTLSATT